MDEEDTILNANSEVSNAFLKGVDSKLNVKVNYEKKDIDYTWLPIFEDTTYYIDNILRNPRKFIVNTEEIVKVEQSKKVTVESIIHLSQHTNYIQKFDKEKGDVKPSKVLNINKEESMDTYENRFIYTVIKLMDEFIDRNVSQEPEESYCIDEKNAIYNAECNIGTEKVNVELKISSINSTESTEELRNGMTLVDRIKKLRIQIVGFKGTELFQTLQKQHVSIVRPPIRRTNVILKNPNFQKAMELYNFLIRFEGNTFNMIKYNDDYIDTGSTKSEFDAGFLYDYLTLSKLSNIENKESNKSYISFTINKILSTILDDNEEETKDNVLKLINKEYDKALKSINTRDLEISNLLNKKLTSFEKELIDKTKMLNKV